MRTGTGVADDRLAEVMICREMHWTHQEYRSQPLWFLDTLKLIGKTESAYQQYKADNSETTNGKHG